MTVQVPDVFLREVSGLPLPPAGAYATGIAFLPVDPGAAADVVALVEQVAAEEGLVVLGWRDVPIDPAGVGPTARRVMPLFASCSCAVRRTRPDWPWNGSRSAFGRSPNGGPASAGRRCRWRRRRRVGAADR